MVNPWSRQLPDTSQVCCFTRSTMGIMPSECYRCICLVLSDPCTTRTSQKYLLLSSVEPQRAKWWQLAKVPTPVHEVLPTQTSWPGVETLPHCHHFCFWASIGLKSQCFQLVLLQYMPIGTIRLQQRQFWTVILTVYRGKLYHSIEHVEHRYSWCLIHVWNLTTVLCFPRYTVGIIVCTGSCEATRRIYMLYPIETGL